MDQRRRRASVGQHPGREVHAEGLVTGQTQIPAQIAGTAGRVEHPPTGRQLERAHRGVPPAPVESEGHDPVDQVVAGGDGVEHGPHGADLGRPFGKGIPGRRYTRSSEAPVGP